MNRLGYTPLSDRDRLEILVRVIAATEPEGPDCGLSPESLKRLKHLAYSHMCGSAKQAVRGYRLDAQLWMHSCVAWIGTLLCVFHVFVGPVISVTCVLVNTVLIFRARPWRKQ